MRNFKMVLASLLCFICLTEKSAIAADYNFGGYTPSVDSPVVSGYTAAQNCTTTTSPIGNLTTTTCYFGIMGFGKVNMEGSLFNVRAFNGSLYWDDIPKGKKNTYPNPSWDCPANTAMIYVKAPYLRSDGVIWQPTVYTLPYPSYANLLTYVTLCVKTDTTP